MVKRVLYGMIVALLLLVGCGKVDDSAEQKTPLLESETPVAEQKEAVEIPEESEGVDFLGLATMETEVVDFPDWVPLPNDYIVILDLDMGSMRQAVLETGDADIRALVARFNEELAALGVEERLLEDEDSKNTNFSVAGSFTYDGIFVMMTVGEYEPGGELVSGLCF